MVNRVTFMLTWLYLRFRYEETSTTLNFYIWNKSDSIGFFRTLFLSFFIKTSISALNYFIVSLTEKPFVGFKFYWGKEDKLDWSTFCQKKKTEEEQQIIYSTDISQGVFKIWLFFGFCNFFQCRKYLCNCSITFS